jgi:predicted permease
MNNMNNDLIKFGIICLFLCSIIILSMLIYIILKIFIKKYKECYNNFYKLDTIKHSAIFDHESRM